MISAHGGLPAHRYTPQVTPRWPRGSEPASVGFPVAVVPSPTPGAVAPSFTGWLRGARGGRPRTRLFVPAARPCRGKGAGRAPRRTLSGPHDGVVPGGSLQLRSWAACAAVVWRVWTRSLTRPVSCAARLSTGDSAGAPGLIRVDADIAPFGSEDAMPGSSACVRVCALLGRVGRASLPGAFWCASPFPVASLCALLVCPAPSALGLPSLLLCPPVVSGVPCRPAGGALGLGVLLPPLPPPLIFFLLFLCPLLLFSFRPHCLRRLVFSGRPCLGPWPLVVPQHPPFFFPFLFFSSSFFLLFLCFLVVCFFCRLCGAGVVFASWAVRCAGVCFGGAVPVVALCGVLSRPSGAGWCCVVLPVVFRCLLLGLAVLCRVLVGLGVLFWWCCPFLAAWLAALWFGVVCPGVPLPCVVFCGAVLSCGGVLSCSAVCLRRRLSLLFVSCRCASAVCVLGCRAVRSLSSPPCLVLCCAVLVPLRFLVHGGCPPGEHNTKAA